jgi:hypothetical protein
MIPLQILGGLLLVAVLIYVLKRWRSGALNVKELAFWLLIFGGILAVLLFPGVSVRVARLLGVQRGTDIVVYGSVGLLYLLVFRVYVSIESLRHQLTVALSELALSGASLSPPANHGEVAPKEADDGDVQA